MVQLVSLALTIVITASIFVFLKNDSPTTTPSVVPRSTTTDSTPSPTPNESTITNANVDPLSLPALFAYLPTGRDLKFVGVQDDNNRYTRYTISYKSDDLTISGILNIPKGDGPFPVLFLNHGYIDPAVYTNGRGLRREQDYFARNGFAVLHTDYRCHAQSDCPTGNRITERLGYVKDVINAVAAVKNSGDSRLSTTAFGMLGHSMGGGITQRLVVSQPDLVKAAVLYAPVSMDERDSFRRYTLQRPAEAEEVLSTYGSLESNPIFWDNLSAKTFVDRVEVPLLYFQGTNDDSVDSAWTDEAVALLRSNNKTVEYVVYDDEPHEFTTTWTDFMARSATFFQDHLTK